MTHQPQTRSTALAGSCRVDVEAAIAPILRRALVRFDGASLRIDQRALRAQRRGRVSASSLELQVYLMSMRLAMLQLGRSVVELARIVGAR